MLFCLVLIIRSDATLLALAAITVFLTYPLYPFVMKRGPRIGQPPPKGACAFKSDA